MTEMVNRSLRRFYKNTGAEARNGIFVPTLDGKPVRTPMKTVLSVPTLALAEALADEWDAQLEEVDFNAMPLNKLAYTAIDRVAVKRREVIEELVRYAGSDQLCYRAEEPDELVERQKTVWQPLLDWAAKHLDVKFELTTGIVHVAQPAATLEAVETALEAMETFHLAGVQNAISACHSVTLGLALSAGRIGPDEAFDASQLDETYQIEQWGLDEEAQKRRDVLKGEIEVSVRFLAHLAKERPRSN